MTPNDLLAQLQTCNFTYYMNQMLGRIPSGLDTREGSIIYDALAPAAMLLTENTMNLVNVLLNTYTQTAQGQFLDYRAAEKGLTRNPATYAQAIASITDMSGQPLANNVIPVGTRFSTVGITPIYFDITEQTSIGQFGLTCEAPGSIGNGYTGQILPVDNINGVGYAQITSIAIPAADAETDDSLRQRILQLNANEAYGGNVADYTQMIETITDVGAFQIYPTWNGGGTVKIVILDNQFNAASTALITEVQDKLDPPASQGNGYGLAPIGHTVTVSAPALLTINVSMTLTTDGNVTVTDLVPTITSVLQAFLSNLVKTNWSTLTTANTYSATLYLSQIESSIQQIKDVTSVSNLTLNGVSGDIILELDNSTQQIPVLGSVTVNG